MADELKDMETRILEPIHDVETHLLSEFRNWARRMDANVRGMKANSNALEERLSIVESRLDDLEQK